MSASADQSAVALADLCAQLRREGEARAAAIAARLECEYREARRGGK